MFSIATVASSTRMPTASASPPSVMMLIVWPSADSAISEVSTASGIEIAMISVARQLPRNSRIIIAVSAAAISASRATPRIADFTNTDWSDSAVMCSALGRPAAMCGSIAFTCWMIVSVDALPDFSIVSSAPRWPFARTMLVCGA
jgi:hypothetical protein